MQKRKSKRLQEMADLISGHGAMNQSDLAEALRGRGFVVTQSTVSRDLAELGAVKIDGTYRLPEVRAAESGGLAITSVEAVAEHLIVIRTPIGQASPVAVAIDRAGFEDVAGTLAGDDTIFVAVRNASDQRRAIKEIVGLFSR